MSSLSSNPKTTPRLCILFTCLCDKNVLQRRAVAAGIEDAAEIVREQLREFLRIKVCQYFRAVQGAGKAGFVYLAKYVCCGKL